jgi:hypothetical protein
MKKLFVLGFILLGMLLPVFTISSSAAIIEEAQSNTLTQYTWGFRDTIDYLNEPLGIGFDFTSLISDYEGFFESVAAISVGAYSTSGGTNSGSSTYRDFMLTFTYDSLTDDLLVNAWGDAFNNTALNDLGTFTFTDISEELPFLLIGFDFTSNSDNSALYEDRSVSLRFGQQSGRIAWGNTAYTSTAFQAAFDISSTYNPGVKFIWNYSTFRSPSLTNPSYFTLGSSPDLYLSNVASVNSSIFDAILGIAYDTGFETGYNDGIVAGNEQVNGLLSLFQMVIGVIVNFVLFIATLEVFDISLLSIFTILAIISGFVILLKFIRG